MVGDDGSVTTREVGLGEFFVDGVQVTGDLSAGEEVVVAGQQKLGPDVVVETRPRRPTDNPLLELGWMGPSSGCEP